MIILPLPPVSCRKAVCGLQTHVVTPAFLCRVWGSNLGRQGFVARSLTNLTFWE